MTRDEIHGLLIKRDAAWAAHDAPALAALHDAAGVVVSPTGGVQEGRADIERVYRLLFSAFPDVTTKNETSLIDGDRAVQVVRFSGTHVGEFFGFAGTGRRMEVTIACVLTFVDGLITEERRIYDFTGLLVQIGVLKAKPQS